MPMKRVIKLGENPKFIFNTGCSIDLANKVKDYTELDFNPYQKYMGEVPNLDYSSGYWVVMQHL